MSPKYQKLFAIVRSVLQLAPHPLSIVTEKPFYYGESIKFEMSPPGSS